MFDPDYTRSDIMGMSAGKDLDYYVAKVIFSGLDWSAPIFPPPYSTDIAYAWKVHKVACQWLFSKRHHYLAELGWVIRISHNLEIAQNEFLVFLEPEHICKAALLACIQKIEPKAEPGVVV